MRNISAEKGEIRKGTLIQWQWYWGRQECWTRAFIRDVGEWCNKKRGDMEYYLTQAVTGHRVFSAYLYRIGKKRDPCGWFCPNENTAEHTAFLLHAMDRIKKYCCREMRRNHHHR